MQTKQFHLGDVLSIITSHLVSPRYIRGMYDILNFMTGEYLFRRQIPRAIDECKPHLVEQFPQFTGAEIDSAVAELGNALKAKSGEAETKKIIADWLTKQVAKYGEMFAVKPLPYGAREFKDPIAEAAEIMGEPEKVIVVIV